MILIYTKIPDQDFPALQILAVRAGVVDLRLLESERLERLTDAGRVVQGKDEPPLHALQQLRQLPEVLAAEEPLAVVFLAVPVRRIDVEEGCSLVVASDDLVVRQAFHICPRQTQVRGGERFLDAEQVELRAAHGGVAEGRVGDPPAEALLLQVVESRRPLDVRQRVGFDTFQALKLVAGHQYPLEVAYKLFQMMLDTPVKRHQLTVYVIDDLDIGFRLSEEHPCRARKGLDVACMLGNGGDDALGELILAAHPARQRRADGLETFVILRHSSSRFDLLAAPVWRSRPAGSCTPYSVDI